MDELIATLRRSAPVGVADLMLNGLPGAVCALLLGWGPTAALALAGVPFVTSSGVTAQLLSDLGWSSHRETPVVLSLLVLEDLTMAAYLARRALSPTSPGGGCASMARCLVVLPRRP